jgi:hypothetical protein
MRLTGVLVIFRTQPQFFATVFGASAVHFQVLLSFSNQIISVEYSFLKE